MTFRATVSTKFQVLSEIKRISSTYTEFYTYRPSYLERAGTNTFMVLKILSVTAPIFTKPTLVKKSL